MDGMPLHGTSRVGAPPTDFCALPLNQMVIAVASKQWSPHSEPKQSFCVVAPVRE